MVRLRSSASDEFIPSFFSGVDKNCCRIGLTDNISGTQTEPGASSQNAVDNTNPSDTEKIKKIEPGPCVSSQNGVHKNSTMDTDNFSSINTDPCTSCHNGIDNITLNYMDKVSSIDTEPCGSSHNGIDYIITPNDGSNPEEMIFEEEEKAQQKLFGTAIILKTTDLLDKVYDDEGKDWKFLGFAGPSMENCRIVHASKLEMKIIKYEGNGSINLKEKKETLIRLKPISHKPVILLPNHSFSDKSYEDMGEDWDFVGFHETDENEDTAEDAKHLAGKVSDKCLNDSDEENLNCMEGLVSSDSNDSIIDSPKPISRYEQIRLTNIKERTEHLIKMGIINKNSVVKPKPKKRISRKVSKACVLPVRRSARLSQSLIDDSSLLSLSYDDSDSKESKEKEKKREMIKLPKSYGVIKGVSIGEIWASRVECSHAGIHRPTVAGIHPGPKGAYSVVLSGGYDDDVDDGDTFMYSGCGGRDLKGTSSNPKNLRVAPQSKDQYKNKSNESLIYSCEHGRAVRVVRGFKLKSAYAPVEGYRYDGLYMIEKWWLSQGHSGFLTYKFLFKRCDNQDLPPWQSSGS